MCLRHPGRPSTKWLDFGGGGEGGTSWLEYRLLAAQPAVVLAQYTLTSADDCPERDPADWRLEGVTEADAARGACGRRRVLCVHHV